jgi:hypothetical protein
VTATAVRAAVGEGRSALSAARRELEGGPAGLLAISGMLAEQLARELGAGADPGVVVVEPRSLAGAEVAVRVIAGVPSEEDVALVRSADGAGVPVVLVQLWPQEHWTPPFVLTPFVVECRAGSGFPVGEIAARIGEAAERAPRLAARIPALRVAVAAGALRRGVVRAALVGALGGRARPLLTLEQIALLARLRALAGGPAPTGATLAAPVAAVVAAGLGLRQLARLGRRVLPAPLVDAAVAAAGTWALAEAVQRLGERDSG